MVVENLTQSHSMHVPPLRAKDARPKIVMQRSQVCDLLVIKGAKPNIREVNNG